MPAYGSLRLLSGAQHGHAPSSSGPLADLLLASPLTPPGPRCFTGAIQTSIADSSNIDAIAEQTARMIPPQELAPHSPQTAAFQHPPARQSNHGPTDAPALR